MMKFLTTFLPLMAAILACYTAEAFSPVARPSLTRVQPLRSSEDDEVTLPTLPSQKDAAPVKVEAAVPVAAPVAAPVTTSTSSVVAKEEEEGTSYPIDLPSPLLLGASMVLAISGTGSLFEILGEPGATTLGFAPTAALAAIGIPMSIFLIYAAIMKGAAETEEDDAEYNMPRKL